MYFHQKLARWWANARANTCLQHSDTHLDRGENERALRLAGKAIALNPTLVDAYNTRGRARYRLKDYAGAAADYSAVLSMGAQRADVYLNRALAYSAQGEIEEALGDANMAIYLSPREALAYNCRGLLDDLQGNLNGAIADYTQAIHLNPRIDVTYNNRGGARASRGDFAGALADYQRYLELGGGQRHGDQSEVEALITTLQGRLQERSSGAD